MHDDAYSLSLFDIAQVNSNNDEYCWCLNSVVVRVCTKCRT